MRSIGLDLQPWIDKNLLSFHADRPARLGLEQHLAGLHRMVRQTRPSLVVIDPVTNLLAIGSQSEIRAMLTRIIDHLKTQGITALFTSLTPGKNETQDTDTMISSLMDTWVLMTLTEHDRQRQREIAVLKSRGMAHSNEIRGFSLTDRAFVWREAPTAGRSAGA
jgi:circadian clock protein KaiC